MNIDEHMNGFRLNPETGYFTCQGVDVIAFEDIYPVGHQGGVSLLLSRVHGPISAPDPEALSGLWSASAVYVDGEPCKKKSKTLSDGDEIWLLSPASGG